LISLNQIDPRKLLEARLWVARLGERDVYGWWATDGVLGKDGAFVGPRVLPLTHATGRARIALTVAAHACAQRHPDPKAISLFRLDPHTEDRLDSLLVERLSERDWWAAMMSRLEGVQAGVDIGRTLVAAGIVTPKDLVRVESLELGPGERSLPLPPAPDEDETDVLQLLAAGFVRSKPGQLAVPYLVNGSHE
jgi:hypothetical protein